MKAPVIGNRMIAAVGLMLATTAAAAPDDSAIREIETRQQAAWNAHDPRGYAATYADDAQFVSARGQRWNGRAEIEQKIAFAFAYGSLKIDDVAIRPLSETLALATVSWTIRGTEARHGIQTQLFQQTAGHWLIVSSQDTASFAEGAVPPPAAPPPPKAAAKPDKPERPCLLASRDGTCLVHK